MVNILPTAAVPSLPVSFLALTRLIDTFSILQGISHYAHSPVCIQTAAPFTISAVKINPNYLTLVCMDLNSLLVLLPFCIYSVFTGLQPLF